MLNSGIQEDNYVFSIVVYITNIFKDWGPLCFDEFAFLILSD